MDFYSKSACIYVSRHNFFSLFGGIVGWTRAPIKDFALGPHFCQSFPVWEYQIGGTISCVTEQNCDGMSPHHP